MVETFCNDVEVARRYGLALITIRTWRARKFGPPFIRLGRSIRYRIADVEAFAALNTIGGGK